MRGIQKTHGLSTGSRTIHGQLERGVRTRGSKLKRNELYDKSSRESDSSNAEEEDSANQGSVTSDNSKPSGDNPSSAGDKNPVNQGSDTTIIVTFQMITPMKVMKAMVIQITTGQVLILFYTCLNSIKMKE